MLNVLRNILIILSLIIVLSSCECGNSKQEVALVDSPAERRNQALKIIESYQMEEWQNDILSRVSKITGSAVTEQLKSIVASRLREKDIKEKRIDLLVKHYTSTELSKMAELYSAPISREILKKHLLADDQLREDIAPLIMEALSK